MRKIILATFFSLLLFILFLVYTTTSSAVDTSTNCFTTQVGNPGSNQTIPAGCENAGGGPIAQTVIKYMRDQLPRSTYILGTPSRNWSSDGDDGPNAPVHYDCSGLVGWAYYKASNGKVSMIGQTSSDWNAAGHSSKYQRHFKSEGVKPQPGDIVYFAGSDGTLSPPNPGHVGVYEGSGGCSSKNDCVIHINMTGLPPKESNFSSMYGDYIGLLRPVIQ